MRSWYHTEAAIADGSGYVKNHERGEVLPPHNEVCNKVLGSREGFRRCNLSVRALVGMLQEPGAPDRLHHICHLGLSMVGVRPRDTTDATFCCGISQRPLDAGRRRVMADKLASIGLDHSQLSGWEKIRVLDHGEQRRLRDVLFACAEQLATSGSTVPTIEERNEDGTLHVKPLKAQLQSLERAIILRGLVQTHWNRARLAKLLGISRTTLLAKIDSYGLGAGPIDRDGEQ